MPNALGSLQPTPSMWLCAVYINNLFRQVKGRSPMSLNNNLTPEQLLAKVAELEAKLAAKSSGARTTTDVGQKLSVKVSEKGAVSVYGMNSRYPVTLYYTQLQRLAQAMPAILEFAEQNKARLSMGKPEDKSE